jgi:hypothetical protein
MKVNRYYHKYKHLNKFQVTDDLYLKIISKLSIIKASHPFSVLMASITSGIIAWKVEGDEIFNKTSCQKCSFVK